MNMPVVRVLQGSNLRRGLIAGLAAIAALFYLAVTPPPALGASYVVDTTSDSVLTACTGAAGDCSLRGAITNASANGGADTITFDSSVTANSITSPDTTGTTGKYTSMALDSSGNPVISYYDESGLDLELLHCGDPNCSSGNSLTSPDTGGDVGRYSSLVLDGSGNPVVSYLDTTNTALKLLRCGNANCTSGNTTVTVDNSADLGYHTSLALDASGFPIISYYEFGAGQNLKVARCGNADCSSVTSVATPDSSGNTGLYTSLVLDGSGYPVVSFYSVTGGDIKVLHCINAGCTGGGHSLVTPDTGANDVGGFTSLALDGSGFPVVSYYDGTDGDLKVLHCGDANCSAGNSVTAPDTGGDVGLYTSLELDGSGLPVVSYYDQTNGDLKVLHCGNANCTAGNSITAPDTSVTVGWYTSLELDAFGNPVVSYYAFDVSDLKVLHCTSANCAASGGIGTITLGSSLPTLSNTGDTIDGAGAIAVRGGGPTAFDCLTISGSAADSNTIKGLRIVNCNDAVVISNGADSNTIGGLTVGERNVISSNNNGVHVTGSSAASNSIRGNFIGTDAAGVTAAFNTTGVLIEATATNTTVGGSTAAHRNVISGNGFGITSSGTGDIVSANYLGVTVNGDTALANVGFNILLNAGSGQTVGGSTAGERNVISGGGSGLNVANSSGTVVKGNYIGTNAAGTAALPNSAYGIRVYGTSDTTTIGGTLAADRNVISGNGTDGILIDQVNTTGTTVLGNYIGVAADGSTDLGNGDDGIQISDSAATNTIGGTTAGAANVISGNGDAGMEISSAGAGNLVLGNIVGTNAAGTASVGNTLVGVWILGSSSTTIGGTTAGHRNLISGNGSHGVYISGASSTNTVLGNYIGTNAAGTAAIQNALSGVFVGGGTGNVVGGTASGSRNVISGNFDDGVAINGASTTTTSVIGNYVGTDVNGTADLGNGGAGITITNDSDGNTVGGTTDAHRNVVSGNNNQGIIVELNSTGNVVAGNYVGTNAAGTAIIANTGAGVFLGGHSNTIGGSAAGARNVISGNSGEGIFVSGASATANTIRGNYIGTDATGTIDLGNSAAGVLNALADGTIIGGTGANDGNVISGNAQWGISLNSFTDNAVVRGNYIGTNSSGAVLGNGNEGIKIDSNTTGHTVGGTAAGAANVIANNGGDGVLIAGLTASVRGNSIYSNTGLGIDLLPNGLTANDAGDSDTGSNNLMNFPVISSATYNVSTRTLTVSGTLDTASPDTAPVDVYSTDTPDGSGNGEGRQYLGSATPSGAGAWTFNGFGIPQGGYITATATKPSDGTSEFSAAFDGDVDGDGFVTSFDNCDVVFNPFQLDHDADSIGDVCDTAVRNRFIASQSSLSTSFTVASGDQLPDETRVIAPWDFQSGAGGPAPNIGSQVGEWDLAFGLKSATACDFGFSQANIKLLAASVDNSPGNLVTTANILADTDGDTIVDGVEGYPAFLNTFYDPERRTGVNEDGDGFTDEDGPNGVDNDSPPDGRVDEDGAGTPVAPHARYFGRYSTGNYFQVLVFEEDADDRYRMETIFNDPLGFPNGVSCAPYESTQVIYTTSVLNDEPNPDVTGGEAVLVDPPSGAGTRVVRGQAIDRADADGDLQDNWVDNCKLVANATQIDGDVDGIGDACDPTPAVNTNSFDHDSDGISNILDNCPTNSNASQAESEVRTPRTFGILSIDDFIGDACDPNPLRVDDVHFASHPFSGRELRGVHINEYSDPICVTGGGVVDADSDGWCAANDPNDSNAVVGPEDESLVLPAGTGTFARGLCSNGFSDDGDGNVDFQETECTDQDGDFIPDNVDLCDQASDPLQLDEDADGVGDACEVTSIIDLDAVSTSNAANSELRWRFVEPAPRPLHKQDGILQLIDSELDGTSDWGIVGGAGVANGAIRATLTDFVTVGIDPDPLVPLIGGRPCVNVLPLNFTLLDASTDPNDAIDNGATLTALGADGDADGLVNGVEQYPAFLKSLPIGHALIDNDGDLEVDEDPVDSINNDGDGLTDEDPTESVAPLVRMFGYTMFQGAPRVLNVLVYSVGALPNLPNTDGYPVVMVYDNPFAYTPRYNVQATCSHQDHRMSTFGISVDFPGTPANEGGTILMNNDSAATTERFFTRVTSYPDLDGDLIENPLDACPFDADNDEDATPDQSDATPWNPRLLVSPGDPDLDGLPNKCDPNDGVPSPPGSPSDEDSDGIGNNADNCRTLANSNQRDSDTDGLGDACDPNTTLPSGAVQAVIYGHPVCTAGTNLDDDDYCADVDPNDNDGNRAPESAVYDPSICSNGFNDDFPQDLLIDLADPGCEDIDGDQVLDAADNCPDTKNGPGQASVPGVGNQLDFDNDVGTVHLGQQPFARTDLGDPYVVGEPFSRTDNHKWGGDACDPDDDNDFLPDGNECDEVDDGDGFVNDGCTALGLFSEGDQPPTACSNGTDEADEDLIEPGNQNDDTVPNDGCPQQGDVSEDQCRTDPDCDDDLFGDLAEWQYPCLKMHAYLPSTASKENAGTHNADPADGGEPVPGDLLFSYGEVVIGTNPCADNNSDPAFGLDDDQGVNTGDDYLRAIERYLNTLPTDNCAAGTPSGAWPADLSSTIGSVNKISVADVARYIAPVRLIGLSPSSVNDQSWIQNRRYDLVPGTGGAGSAWINTLDLANILAVNPPMAPFNGVKAFGSPLSCTP